MPQFSKQKGFTLIELIIVIVLLGILAAFALPRFANLTTASNEAALDGLEGALRSASSIVYSQAVIQGVQQLPTSSVDLNGDGTGDINVEYGYPSDDRSDGIVLAMSDGFADEWAWTSRLGPQRVVIASSKVSTSGAGEKVNNVPITTNNCYLTYIGSTAVGAPPTITKVTSGC